MMLTRVSQLGKKSRTNKNITPKNDPLIRSVSLPVEKGFYFYYGLGEPTGIYATSMKDFLEQLKTVDVKSVQFHSDRNDFSTWLREIFNDGYLADAFEGLRSTGLSGENVRMRLVELTEKRCREICSPRDTDGRSS